MKKFLMALTCACICLLFLLHPQSVYAANPAAVTLKEGKTYTGYDITGDRRNDRISMDLYKNNSYDMYDTVKISINGHTAYSLRSDPFFEYKTILYTLSNQKPFLYVYCIADNYDGPVCALFQYQSGKLKKVIDFQNMFPGCGSHCYGEVLKVSGNSIKAEFYVMSYTIGPSHYRYNYSYKGGTLKRTSTIGTLFFSRSMSGKKNTFTANKRIALYTSANAKKVSFFLNRKDTIKFDRIYRGSYGTWLRGKCTRGGQKGKSGWIKCLTRPLYYPNHLFSDVGYAG